MLCGASGVFGSFVRGLAFEHDGTNGPMSVAGASRARQNTNESPLYRNECSVEDAIVRIKAPTSEETYHRGAKLPFVRFVGCARGCALGKGALLRACARRAGEVALFTPVKPKCARCGPGECYYT